MRDCAFDLELKVGAHLRLRALCATGFSAFAENDGEVGLNGRCPTPHLSLQGTCDTKSLIEVVPASTEGTIRVTG